MSVYWKLERGHTHSHRQHGDLINLHFLRWGLKMSLNDINIWPTMNCKWNGTNYICMLLVGNCHKINCYCFFFWVYKLNWEVGHMSEFALVAEMVTSASAKYTHLSYGLLPHIWAALLTSQVQLRDSTHRNKVKYHATQRSSSHKYTGSNVGIMNVRSGIRIL